MTILPTLTIAIPTFNRSEYLRRTLATVQQQRALLADGYIELLILDNNSSDDTLVVIQESHCADFPIQIIRRQENVGSDLNIAEAFDCARGRYVWILSDDDLPVPGALQWIEQQLDRFHPTLLYLRPYGYESNPTTEFPRGGAAVRNFSGSAKFVSVVGPHLTFISSMVVNKSVIPEVSARVFVGTSLVQLEIYLSAILKGGEYVGSGSYWVACKRNNSGGYDFTYVFVEQLSQILRRFHQKGLPVATVNAFRNAMLSRYFPQYMFLERLTNKLLPIARQRFRTDFGRNWLYWLMVDPILSFPRPLALLYGAVAVGLGRVLGGDFRRGLNFLKMRLKAS